MASMQDVQPRFGYTDLVNMPEDGRRYEIYGGELVVVPSPLPRHQLAVLAIVRILDACIAKTGGIVLTAPLDIVFDEFDVVQPDVLFFRAERRHLLQPHIVTRHAPDMAVEVLSPSTASTDRRWKMRTFARYGVPEYWIVDPVLKQIEVHALRDGAYRETQVRMSKAAVKPPEVITLTCRVSLVVAVRATESCAGLGYATARSTARENKTDTDDCFIACRATARCRGVRCAGSGPRTRGGSRREVRCRRSPSYAPGLSGRRCIRPTLRANRPCLPPPRAVRHPSD